MNNVIETVGLTVEFSSRCGVVQALDSLDLAVESGSIFGFLGPNGAGKTTAMHVLLGFISATSGIASIFGDDVRHSIARQRIGYLPEIPETYKFLTGRELLMATGHLFLMKGKKLRSRVEELLAMVGLDGAAERRTGTYSRGMLQRICLAQSLVNDPDLLILDEPTSGLDPVGRMKIREIILQLRTHGKTIFFSSHELSEVELVCDRLAILSQGRIVAEGRASEIIPPGKDLEKYFLGVIGRTEHA